MNYEQALALVRAKHPKDLIRNYFFYDGKYIFAISKGLKYVEDDPSAFHVSIDSKTGEYALYDFWTELLMNHDPSFDKALQNLTVIYHP